MSLPNQPATVIGVDGARGHWAMALVRATSVEFSVALDFDEVMVAAEQHSASVVAVDMPIGLPSAGSRECDIAARQQIKGCGSRVFPAPIRGVLKAMSYDEALAISRAATGRGLSIQAWNLVPAIREVDPWGMDARVVEAHPEVSFALMAGRPILASKKTAEGRAARLALVIDWLGPLTVPRGDDHLDALACAWTARRVAAHQMLTLGAEPPAVDDAGRPMRILA